MKKSILILVLVVFVLISGSYFYLGIMQGRNKQGFIHEDMVRGSALIADGLNYTFSFIQQTAVLSELNHAKKANIPNPPDYTPGRIERLVIYPFDQKEPLEIIPASDDFSLFKFSTGKKGSYLRIDQPEDLQNILEHAYDK